VWLIGDPAWLVPAVLGGSMIFALGIEFFTTGAFMQPQQITAARAEQVETLRRGVAWSNGIPSAGRRRAAWSPLPRESRDFYCHSGRCSSEWAFNIW
jgi:hypothetical protein